MHVVLEMSLPTQLIKQDPLAFQQRAPKQLAHSVSNVGACDDCDGPLLPLAVPVQMSANSFL
jgi:hypothetical protein